MNKRNHVLIRKLKAEKVKLELQVASITACLKTLEGDEDTEIKPDTKLVTPVDELTPILLFQTLASYGREMVKQNLHRAVPLNDLQVYVTKKGFKKTLKVLTEHLKLYPLLFFHLAGARWRFLDQNELFARRYIEGRVKLPVVNTKINDFATFYKVALNTLPKQKSFGHHELPEFILVDIATALDMIFFEMFQKRLLVSTKVLIKSVGALTLEGFKPDQTKMTRTVYQAAFNRLRKYPSAVRYDKEYWFARISPLKINLEDSSHGFE